jgi:hypothetical protein
MPAKDVICKPGNHLSAMRKAATLLLTAYKVSQSSRPNALVDAETLCLEAIDMAKHAIELMRRV